MRGKPTPRGLAILHGKHPAAVKCGTFRIIPEGRVSVERIVYLSISYGWFLIQEISILYGTVRVITRTGPFNKLLEPNKESYEAKGMVQKKCNSKTSIYSHTHPEVCVALVTHVHFYVYPLLVNC